jgi:mannose-6-phosphate isomerase-like protein (cupin superfamily)
MEKMTRIISLLFAIVAVGKSTEVVDLYTPKEIAGMRRQLSGKGQRFASRDLLRYGNHYTMVAYRAATGSSEIHEHEADIFFIEEGTALLITGGSMIGGHLQKAGELRGTSIEGGVKQTLKTGDIVHIPAGVPHQILVTPGKPITYFVVKVSGQ